jgi:hypothetical protein
MSLYAPYLEIACQQVLVEDASVFSVQWIDMPTATALKCTAEELLSRYLSFVKICTMSLVRPVVQESGIELRLLGTGLSLIRFLPPEYADDSVSLHICGGLLVQSQQSNRGELRLGIERLGERVRILLQLSDYCPLILGSRSPSPLRFWLYHVTQAAIHRLVTVRFLSVLSHALAGPSAGVRIVNVAVRTGRDV